MAVVVLHGPFRGMGAWRNSTDTQQSGGHVPRCGPGVKNGSSAKDGVPKRLGCGANQEEVSCRVCPQALHE